MLDLKSNQVYWLLGINPRPRKLSSESHAIVMSASLSKLTVPQLKKQLVASGLSVEGRKADLVQRLQVLEKGSF